MIVENKTKISNEEAITLLVKETNKQNLVKLILPVVMFLSASLLLIFGYNNQDTTFKVLSIFIIIMGLVYIGYLVYCIISCKKAVIKNNPDLTTYGADFTYSFHEQSIEITALCNGKKNKVKYKYTDLKKVVEYKDYYLFLFSDKETLYIHKSGFVNAKHVEFLEKTLKKNKKKITKKIK